MRRVTLAGDNGTGYHARMSSVKSPPTLALLATLAASFTCNVWLLARERNRGDTQPAASATTTAGGRAAGMKDQALGAGPSDPRPAVPLPACDAGSARTAIAALEREIADDEAEIARYDGFTSLEMTLGSRGALHEKLAAIAMLGENERATALEQLATRLDRDQAGDETLRAALSGESEPALLVVLSRLIEQLSTWREMPTASFALAVDLLRNGEPSERRVAAAALLVRGCRDEDLDARTAAVAAALVSDPDARVAGTLSRSISAGGPAGEDAVLAALRSAAARLPAGDDRRDVLGAIARTTVMRDRGREMFDRWQAANSPTEQEEIGRALARALFGRVAGRAAAKPALSPNLLPLAEARQRLLAMYRSLPDPETREDLCDVADRALGLFPDEAEDAGDSARFLRDLAATESDDGLREHLRERAADLDRTAR